jgi:hypothetical protein
MKCYFEKKLPEVPAAEIDARIEEAVKFLNMAVYCEGNIPVSKEIDEIWHYWILETKEYAKLCAALQGRKFIHHSSNVYAECNRVVSEALDNDLGQGVAMLANYVLNYGPFQPDRVKYWLLATHLVEDCGMTIDHLNAWLTSGLVVGHPRLAKRADSPTRRSSGPTLREATSGREQFR